MSLGGDLPSLHDDSTNTSIASLVNTSGVQTMWIGLHDTINEKAFEWSDGTLLDFSNFFEFEPSSASMFENCVEIYSVGKWNDFGCHNFLPYVCYMKPGSPNTSALESTAPAQN
ncbi:C-type mannose receptor 2 [Bulinus truncatus]|nr:C-type mannose receptor 2 [Bulinus truncatus]